MIAELGHFSLILALCMAIVLGMLPIIGAYRSISGWVAVARPAAFGQFFFMAVSYGCLTYGFLTHDFSVKYIATNSNTALPVLYLVSGVWGAHEGSLLLWALVLSCWTGLVALFSRAIPEATVARVLGVMGLVSIGFTLFLLLTSNPFERLFIWAMSAFPWPLLLPLPLCSKAGWMPPGHGGQDLGLILRGCF
jgi:cytochrome c-type biogenesis protein CcmF